MLICLTGCATSVSSGHVPLPTIGYPDTPKMPRNKAEEIAAALGEDKALDLAAYVMLIHETYKARIDRLNKLIEEHNKLYERKD